MPDHHGADHAHHGDAGDAALAELLDLDGEVLRTYWADVMTWVRQSADAREHILDLGAGSGVGTVALAQQFPHAEVIAVDTSHTMLSRIRAKALKLGLAERIRVVQADLNDVWPDVGLIDIAWASMSMHHFADPDRVLRDVFAATRPGGLAVIAEMAEQIRFLPDDIGFGRPGLEARCLDALSDERAHSLPELGSDWAPRLEAAGFTVLDDRVFSIELNTPNRSDAARYAQLWLRRMRSAVAQLLTRDDLESLAILIDEDGPESLQRRRDLQIRGSRAVTLARRG